MTVYHKKTYSGEKKRSSQARFEPALTLAKCYQSAAQPTELRRIVAEVTLLKDINFKF